MVITRHDWRINGDLLEWLALTYPGLSVTHFEAAYRLLSPPDLSDEALAQLVNEGEVDLWEQAAPPRPRSRTGSDVPVLDDF